MKKKEEEEEEEEGTGHIPVPRVSAHTHALTRGQVHARLRARARPPLKHEARQARVRPSTRTHASYVADKRERWWGGASGWMGVGARHGARVGGTAHVFHPLPSSPPPEFP